MSRALWLLALLCACSHSEKTERADQRPAAAATQHGDAGVLPPDQREVPRTIPPDPRYYTAATAPDPLACRADKDCIADTIVDPGHGCCVQGGDPMPQTWAWHAWATEHRMSSSCEDVHCDPVPVPDKMPRACVLEARCIANRCSTSCTGDAGVAGR